MKQIEHEIRERLRESMKTPLVTRKTIAEYIGYTGGNLPVPIEEALGLLFETLPTVLDPCADARIIGAATAHDDGLGMTCAGVPFETGRIIARGLSGSEHLLFFAATAGPGLDEWAQRAASYGNEMLAYVIDCSGSIIAEGLADRIERITTAITVAHGLSSTCRYSPGYCGWNVGEQKKFFSLLPGHFCGITLTESGLMVPLKSVSGIIGIGTGAQKRAYECAECSRTDCIHRKLKDR